jgi:hypothetical protein
MHTCPEQLLLEKAIAMFEAQKRRRYGFAICGKGMTASSITNQLTRGSRLVPLAAARSTRITERCSSRSCWKCK